MGHAPIRNKLVKCFTVHHCVNRLPLICGTRPHIPSNVIWKGARILLEAAIFKYLCDQIPFFSFGMGRWEHEPLSNRKLSPPLCFAGFTSKSFGWFSVDVVVMVESVARLVMVTMSWDHYSNDDFSLFVTIIINIT